MNPCPCGYYGDMERECKCSAYEVIKYQKGISGPLLDRIDLQIKLGRIKIGQLRKGGGAGLESCAIKEVVQKAKEKQKQRFGGAAKTNSEMSSREAQEVIKLDRDGENFLQALDKSHLSPRAYYRLLKVARTIADIEGQATVNTEHLAEAFSYRLRETV
jgi:magnesium chelatase family protein